MQKNSLIIIAIVLVALGAVGGYFFINSMKPERAMDVVEETMEKEDVMMKKDEVPAEETMMKPEGETMKKEESMMSDSRNYVAFSPQALADSAKSKRVLFFYANWCPTCKPVDKELSENSAQIPEGVTIIRVNYNDTETDQAEKDLAKKYEVTYQHTFVQIDAQGNKLTQWNGGSINEIVKNIK